MKNKFAFDLPRLKIGTSKPDPKSPKEIPIGFDSPPPTPKSVRPPLDAKTDYALRTACALVLQDYKPSDVVYEEQYGTLEDAQEDHEYEIVRNAVERELESPLVPVNTSATRTLRQRTMSGERLSERSRYDARPFVERSPRSEDFRSAGTQRRSLLERAEELRFRLNAEPISPTDDRPYHQRSASNPFVLVDVAPSNDQAERTVAGARSDSMMTEGITPGTEDEEFCWPASTAPTTAGITPARTSNRTSNVLRAESANNSTAKFLASDTEWMRQELEKYKKAQEEAPASQGSEERASTGATTDADAATKDVSATQVPPPIPPIPARKPVPRPGAESRQSNTSHQRGDSRPSGELSRSGSKKSRSTPLSESRAEIGLLRPESRRADDEFEEETEPMLEYSGPASHSFHRRPLAGTAAPYASYNVSNAGSRSRSLTRQIKEFIRPSSRNESRNGSRPESRARSIASFASSVTPSVESSSKWRRFRPFNKNRDSGGSDDWSRPESGHSRRGRKASQDAPTSPTGNSVNLNRELPPLPSLDQWKDEDITPPSQDAEPETMVYEIKRNPSTGRNVISPVSSRSQKPSVDSTASQQPRDSVLVDNTLRIHPKRMSSLRARTELAQYPTTDPVSMSLPQSPALNVEQKKELRQSQSIQEFPHDWSSPPTALAAAGQLQRPAVPPKDPTNLHNTSGNMDRATSQRLPFATRRSGASNTELHSRAISDQPNFSRKLSSEDYSRMHDTRFKSIPETPPRKPVPANTAPVEQEKPKKKWWQPSSKLKKRRESWIALTGA